MTFQTHIPSTDKKDVRPTHHMHAATDICPTCDQLIPPERIEEVLGRLSARDAEKEGAVRTVLQKQFEIDKAHNDAKAQATLEEARQQAAAQVDAAREDERKKAEAATAEKLAQSAAKFEALQTQIAVANEKRATAEQAGETLKRQLSEVTKVKDAEIAAIKETAIANEARIRKESAEAAQAAVTQQLADKDNVILAANAKAAEAEGRMKLLATEHELALKNGLDGMRETMEKAKDEAVSAEKSKNFEENQKLLNKVGDLQRQLDKKTNDELGEGAEIELYEELRAEFSDDEIKNVKRGEAGADIIHTVKHNGKACGKIIYDSKNHKQYRQDHVTKLREDQAAEGAEHAILSLLKLRSGTRQLHIEEGIILANPARVKTLVTILRQHMIQVHSLRMSAIERESKVGALYDYVTSDIFSQQLARVEEHAEEMLTLQETEIRQHKKMWEKEGELLRKIQKAKVAISDGVSAIIGTAAVLGEDDEQAQSAGGEFG